MGGGRRFSIRGRWGQWLMMVLVARAVIIAVFAIGLAVVVVIALLIRGAPEPGVGDANASALHGQAGTRDLPAGRDQSDAAGGGAHGDVADPDVVEHSEGRTNGDATEPVELQATTRRLR